MIAKPPRRKSRHYDGTETTSRLLKDILPFATSKIKGIVDSQGDAILAYWPELVGDRIHTMTKAVSFSEGALTVRVTNSTLYSLLVQQERMRLLLRLREKFPGVTIKTILFRMG